MKNTTTIKPINEVKHNLNHEVLLPIPLSKT